MGNNMNSKSFVIFCLLLNVALSIAIVLLNKWIYTRYGFPNLTMTCLHFIFTTIGLVICEKLGIFQPKSLPIKQMLPLSLTFCGFVVFTNLSLQTNSVGAYQLAKTLTTPCIIIIQSNYYNVMFSHKVKLTVIPIALGVFLNTYYDIRFNFLGLVYATAGVIVTSLYQVWVGAQQHEFQCNSMQLLYYQAPLSATLLFFVIPFFEPLFGDQGMFAPWSYEAVMMVTVSGIVAFMVNLSIFWIIGNTSPLTYNMVGHLKFCLTLLAGYLLFHDSFNYLQWCGTFLALLGSAWYSWVILTSGETASSEKSHRD